VKRKPFIFIVSQLHEPNVDQVIARLERRGVDFFRFDTETLPLVSTVRVYDDGSDSYAVISCNGQTVDTRQITTIWRRRIGEFILPDNLDERTEGFVKYECAALLHSFFEKIECFWVNHFLSDYRANIKSYQLQVARQVGLRVPRTLVTNEPEAVEEFMNQCNSKILFKPVIGLIHGGPHDFSQEAAIKYKGQFRLSPHILTERPTSLKTVFSQLLTPEKIPYLKFLPGCPATFQEYIEKRFDVRITIIGNELFAVEVHSQDNSETQIDFRRQALDPVGFLDHEIHHLPDQTAQKLLCLMNKLQLVFGCVDMVLTPEGEYVFLEVNTAGQWGWMEHLLGLPMTDVLTELLIRGSL
jgi:glutathione synthase/RimK-type ligase-like ATP-grasp enzyme